MRVTMLSKLSHISRQILLIECVVFLNPTLKKAYSRYNIYLTFFTVLFSTLSLRSLALPLDMLHNLSSDPLNSNIHIT